MNARKDQKRQEAEARNAKWAALTYEQQIAQLDTLFGEGQGATKQRAKIARQITLRDQKQTKSNKGNPKGKSKK